MHRMPCIMTSTFSLFTMFRFGYNAQHTGYLFAYVGILAVIVQRGLMGRIMRRFGEPSLVIAGALLLAGSLFAVPFIGPRTGGLLALLGGGGLFSIGNSISAPSLASLASKSVGAADQGSIFGVTQSVASLARAVGPTLAALLIHSAVAYEGADGQTHFMSDHSLFVIFWTASAIMVVALFLSVYFARTHAAEY
jgi:DHA1 family tetracycline resistance protein-like MFS transporter